MLTIIKTPITDIQGVRYFFSELCAEGLGFHPEESPRTAIDRAARLPLFSAAECDVLDQRIIEVGDVCEAAGVDPCEVYQEVTGEG